MSQSVTKHRYWSGKEAVKAVSEYSNYLKYREGEDKEKGGRVFFDAEKDKTDIDLRETVKNLKTRGAAAHELVLSPGVNTVDPMAYTRELMGKLERSKGQELEWVAVAHSNTDHNHIHVLLSGESKDKKPVLLRKDDHANMREWGDKYLEREHFLERYLDREADREIDRGFEYDRGDQMFNRLVFGIKGGKEQQKARPERAERKPKEWSKERAIAELPDSEKIITSQGEVLSKFSKQSELKQFCQKLADGQEKRLSKEEYKKLWSWIGTKEKAGDDYYERKEREKDKEKELGEGKQGAKKASKTAEKRQEYTDWSKRKESRRHYLDYSKKPRSQRIFEQRGRELDQYTYAQLTIERSRIKDLMARQPEKREVYEHQLEQLEAYKKDIEKDFEKVDLDSVMGWKKRGDNRGREQNKEQGGDKPGEDKEEERQEQQRQRQEEAQKSEQVQQQQREQLSQADEATKAEAKSREQEGDKSRGIDESEREMYGR